MGVTKGLEHHRASWVKRAVKFVHMQPGSLSFMSKGGTEAVDRAQAIGPAWVCILPLPPPSWVWPWASHFPTLGYSFLTYKIGIIAMPPSYGRVRIKFLTHKKHSWNAIMNYITTQENTHKHTHTHTHTFSRYQFLERKEGTFWKVFVFTPCSLDCFHQSFYKWPGFQFA